MESEDADLDIDDGPSSQARPGNALARVRAVSVALSDAARRSRVSSRRARQLSSGGFENRRGARLVRRMLLASFLAVFVVPTLAAAVYFGAVAANQYVAQAEFTVSAGESPLRDGVESLSGAPMQLILQDTQILTNFLNSREIVDQLEQRVGLRKLYSRDEADFYARFNPDKPVERLVKYWSHVAQASVKLPGGLVKFSVRAFTPQDAKTVADATLALCEDLVNNLNARINHDALALAEASMNRAAERLSRTLAAEEVARNQSGMLETNLSAQALIAQLRPLKSSLLNLSGAYQTQLRDMNVDTPQMQGLKARIEVLQSQIAKLEGLMTTAPGAPVEPASAEGGSTVSAAMSQFGELDTERRTAEQLYANAASALEHARIAAEFKMIYLKTYVRPSLPQESEYPQRGLDVFLVAVSSLALWGLLVAMAAVVRNNMA